MEADNAKHQEDNDRRQREKQQEEEKLAREVKEKEDEEARKKAKKAQKAQKTRETARLKKEKAEKEAQQQKEAAEKEAQQKEKEQKEADAKAREAYLKAEAAEAAAQQLARDALQRPRLFQQQMDTPAFQLRWNFIRLQFAQRVTAAWAADRNNTDPVPPPGSLREWDQKYRDMLVDPNFRAFCPLSWRVQLNPGDLMPEWGYLSAVPGFTNKPGDGFPSQLMRIFQEATTRGTKGRPNPIHPRDFALEWTFWRQEAMKLELLKVPAVVQQYTAEWSLWRLKLFPTEPFPGSLHFKGVDPRNQISVYRTNPGVIGCHNCNRAGHWFWACPEGCANCGQPDHKRPSCRVGHYVPPVDWFGPNPV